MKKNVIKKMISCLMFFLVGGVLLATGAAKAGFGLTPPSIINDKLSPNSTYEQSILIIRDDPITSVKAKATINVPGADNWITIDKGLSFDLPKGQKMTPIIVRVNVPTNAEFKEYKGTIDIVGEPDALKQGAVNIGLGGQIAVDLTVVNEKISSFVVNSVKTVDSREGENINVIVAITNKGNIATVPTKAILDIYDSSKKNLIATKENINSPDKIKQFSSGNVNFQFDSSDIQKGSYWGKVKVYNGTELIFEGEVAITVLEKSQSNTISVSTSWTDKLLAKIGLSSIASNILYMAVLVVILLIVLIALRSNRKNKSSKKVKAKK